MNLRGLKTNLISLDKRPGEMAKQAWSHWGKKHEETKISIRFVDTQWNVTSDTQTETFDCLISVAHIPWPSKISIQNIKLKYFT